MTGGSGFIGTNVVERLRARGARVVNLDTTPPRKSDHHDFWRELDLLDAPATEAAMRALEPTLVVHLAARTDLEGAALADYEVNVAGTRNLVGAAATLERPPRLIVASTQLVCRSGYQPRADDDYCPATVYGESKVETEGIVRGASYPGEWLLVRPTSIWGPWFGVPYRDFFLAVAGGRYLHPAGVRSLKSFGYVENTSHQIAALLTASADSVHGRTFYLADYEPLELSDWAARIQAALGAPRVRTAPLPLLRAAATVGDLLRRLGWEGVPLTNFRLDNLVDEMLYDLEETRSVVPELPFSLDHGVQRTVAWLRDTGALKEARHK
ncbi:MAG: NAD(P)-dependent oxidoreductase [Thermoleophilaceae bacterium]